MKMNPMYIISCLVSCALFLFPTALPGQHQVEVPRDSSDIFTSHEPVIVTATRTRQQDFNVPYAIQKIHLEEEKRTGLSNSLADLVQTVPGVIVQDRNNRALGERIMVRGIGSRAQFGVRGVKLLLDNIPLTLPDGQSQTGLIDPNTLHTIEIIRGPASGLHGNAAGGVIALRTRLPKTSAFDAEFQYTSGSFGLQKIIGQVSGSGRHSRFFAGISHVESEGFRDHSASKYLRGTGIYRWRLNDHVSTTAVLHVYDAPYLLNPSSLDKQTAKTNPESSRTFIRQQGAGEQVRQVQGGVTVDVNTGSNSNWKSTLYGIKRELLNPIPGRIIELGRRSGGIRSVLNLPPNLFGRNLSFSAGIDFGIQDDARTEYSNVGIADSLTGTLRPPEILSHIRYGDQVLNQREIVLNAEPFLLGEFGILPELRLSAGGRWNHYLFRVTDHLRQDSTDDSDTRIMRQLTPMIGLTWQPASTWNIYGNYTTAFQTPTTSELSNRPDNSGGFAADLEPEFIHNVEFGSRGRIHEQQFQWDIALFRMWMKEMLIPYQVESPGSEEIYFENAGSATNTGWEFRINHNFIDQIKSTFMVTYQNFIYRDYSVEGESTTAQLSGNTVPGIPKLLLGGDVRYGVAPGHFIGISANYQSEYFTNNYNGNPPGEGLPSENYINDDFITVDLTGGLDVPLGQLDVSILGEIRNVLDARYNASIVPNAFGHRYFEPAPGRSYTISISLKYSHK